MEHLVEVARQEKAQRESTAQTADVKGALAMYTAKQLTRGLTEEVVSNRVRMLKRLRTLGGKLLDPVSIWQTINTAKKADGKPWS